MYHQLHHIRYVTKFVPKRYATNVIQPLLHNNQQLSSPIQYFIIYLIFYNLHSPFLTKKCGSSIRNGINRTHQQNNHFLF